MLDFILQVNVQIGSKTSVYVKAATIGIGPDAVLFGKFARPVTAHQRRSNRKVNGNITH